MIPILPLEIMTDKVSAVLKNHGIDPATPDMCLKLDQDMKGDYGEVWLVYSRADGNIYRVIGDGVETFPLSRMTAPYIDNYTTSNRLQVHLHGEDDPPPEQGDMTDEEFREVKKSYGIAVLAVTVFLFDSVYAIAWGAVVSTLISAFVNASPNRKLLGYGYLEQMKDVLPSMALAVVMFYSYCKRFTSLAHMVLGLSLGIAPVGAYIAVTGEFALVPCILSLLVMTWCGSFDIIYALQDKDFDRANGLHSIPAKFSVRTSLYISIALHVVTIACLGWFVALLPQSVWIWTGAAIFTAIIIAEHIIVTPTRQRNIPIAFGTLNGLASLSLATLVIIGLLTA